MTSCLGKLLERMVAKRLVSFILKNVNLFLNSDVVFTNSILGLTI